MAQNPLLWLVGNIVQLYSFAVLAYIIVQLLIQFGYAQRGHPITVFFLSLGQAVVEPALRFIRRYVPPISNMDFSPLILLLGLQFMMRVLVWALF